MFRLPYLVRWARRQINSGLYQFKSGERRWKKAPWCEAERSLANAELGIDLRQRQGQARRV
jgi:hypothetical protein